jgi:LDH2 family malate/lactate/ureidoglycolate dehydrogenase
MRILRGTGGRLPPGAALDAAGQPTDDPEAAAKGCLLPAAGPKGYGLALMVEILAGALTGAGVGRAAGSIWSDQLIDRGHVFVAIALERFLPRPTFLERIGELLHCVKRVRPVEGGEAVRYPGEIRGHYAATYARNGIPCDPAMERVIEQFAAELGVRRPWELPVLV